MLHQIVAIFANIVVDSFGLKQFEVASETKSCRLLLIPKQEVVIRPSCQYIKNFQLLSLFGIPLVNATDYSELYDFVGRGRGGGNSRK